MVVDWIVVKVRIELNNNRDAYTDLGLHIGLHIVDCPPVRIVISKQKVVDELLLINNLRVLVAYITNQRDIAIEEIFNLERSVDKRFPMDWV